jgi:Flp pilus assembly protein TadG
MKALSDNNLHSNAGPSEKRGFTAVECSFVVLALCLVAFCTIEFGRIAMMQHALTEAVGVAAREASLPTISSAATVETNLRERLSSSISMADDDGSVSISVSPRDLSTLSSGDSVRVQVAMNYSEVSWIPSQMLQSLASQRILSAEATQERE